VVDDIDLRLYAALFALFAFYFSVDSFKLQRNLILTFKIYYLHKRKIQYTLAILKT